jgi:predicted nucleic acid-binding protein
MITSPNHARLFSIEVVPQSRQSFLDALALYEARPDKDYSLTDCASMTTMQAQAIKGVLTRDAHFLQEGFVLRP